jgi:transposase
MREDHLMIRRCGIDMPGAAGICEAVTRPSMRFIAMRTPENQEMLMHHKCAKCWWRNATN